MPQAKNKTVHLLRTVSVILCALIMTGILSGCSRRSDINDMMFVMGLGLDHADDERILFTFQIAVPVGADTAVSENNVEYSEVSIAAPTLAYAFRDMEERCPGTLSLEHLSCIIVGEDILHRDIPEILSYLTESSSARKQCVISTCRGRAEDVFRKKYDGGSLSVSAATTLEHMDDSRSRTGIMTLGRLPSAAVDPGGYYLYSFSAIPTNSEGTSPSDSSAAYSLKVSGVDVFSVNRHSGYIEGDNAMLLRLFTGEQTSGIITSIDEHGSVFYFEILSASCKKDCKINGSSASFSLDINVECRQVDFHGDSMTDDFYLSSEELSASLHKRLMTIIKRCQSDLGAAPTGLADEARQTHRLWYEENKDRWQYIFSNAQIELNVNCHLEGEK